MSEPTPICMVYDDDGNAFDSFPYTADDLEAAALNLRDAAGEITTITVGPSPFLVSASGLSR